MLEKFSVKFELKGKSGIFDELRDIRLKKSLIYSANLIPYALMLHYTSLQSYRLLL